MELDPPPLEHCAECGEAIDPNDLGDVVFHALGHNERSREAAAGAIFLGGADHRAWEFEKPKGHA
jgi:predicted nucleic acid-binding Zn ribbon protein